MPTHFRHLTSLHGQAHVTRVMVHATRLVEATGQHGLSARLWASVFLHDLARTHDGICHRHGADAAARLREEAGLQARLAEAGLTAADHPAIEAAVTAHSAPKEVPRDPGCALPAPPRGTRHGGLRARAVRSDRRRGTDR